MSLLLPADHVIESPVVRSVRLRREHRLGATPAVAKPFDYRVLLSIVGEVLAR